MKKVLMMLCAVMLVFGMVGSASATVLTFDDFTTTSYEAIPDGYGGFNWDNATTIGVVNGPIHTPGSGYEHGAVSGNYTAFNYNGASPSYIDLAGSGTFTFNGAWFTSAWSNQTISFNGYNNGSLLYTSSPFSINTSTPLWIELGWSGIDRLAISNTGSQWAMDNFTFDQSAPVPEPSTMLLMGVGLIGLAGYGRKRLMKKG